MEIERMYFTTEKPDEVRELIGKEIAGATKHFTYIITDFNGKKGIVESHRRKSASNLNILTVPIWCQDYVEGSVGRRNEVFGGPMTFEEVVELWASSRFEKTTTEHNGNYVTVTFGPKSLTFYLPPQRPLTLSQTWGLLDKVLGGVKAL